ncbi:MAG: ornithine carbamoyltransferase [Rhodospirillaceae bacterium]
MSTIKHFLDLNQFDTPTLRALLARGEELRHTPPKLLAGRTLAMIFEKPSTRTRVSFEVGMRQLGGDVVILSDNTSQLGRGETIADTARVLSRYVDAIMIRTDKPSKLIEMAAHASVPVINGLTDASHPCQVMADIMTFEQHRGSLKGKTVLWSGDGNNVAVSWVHAATRFGFEMRLACPDSLAPPPEVIAWARAEGAAIVQGTDPMAMAEGCDCVVTDTWVSMGCKEKDSRNALLIPYQVNETLMARAKPDALFMHCLPAHRGEEVVDAVIDGPNSVVWDEAENRLHVQKAILAWCLGV